MKCKVCKEEINLTVFGMPNDICWGCLQDEQKKEVIYENVKVKIKKPKQK
jgi:hypothetical protein